MNSPLARRAAVAGPLLVLGYCLINSTKSVLEGALVQRMSPEFLAFNTFVIAQGFYLVVCRDKRALVAAVHRNRRDLGWLNLSTAVSWVAVLYAFTVFEPVVANSIIIGLAPSFTILLGFWIRPDARPIRLEVIAALGMLTAMVYLTVISWVGSSAVGELSGGEIAFGLAACVSTSIALSGVVVFTKRLTTAGMTVSQVMASRFVLLLAGTLTILLIRGSFSPYSLNNVLVILLVASVGVILSLHLLQMGIARTEPVTVSMLFGTNIVITYVTQFLDPRLDQSWQVFLGMTVFTLCVCLGTWARSRASAPAAPAAEPGPLEEMSSR